MNPDLRILPWLHLLNHYLIEINSLFTPLHEKKWNMIMVLHPGMSDVEEKNNGKGEEWPFHQPAFPTRSGTPSRRPMVQTLDNISYILYISVSPLFQFFWFSLSPPRHCRFFLSIPMTSSMQLKRNATFVHNVRNKQTNKQRMSHETY